MEERKSIHGEWSSRWAFILAATGSAIGLGNIWKFPYITGKYGGSAFVIIYLAAVITIGLPLLMAEVLLGRHGRQNPYATMRDVAIESGRTANWRFVGLIAIFAGFIILSYYSVIAGWTLDYIFKSALNSFQGQTPAQIKLIFTSLIQSPWHLLLMHSIVMIMTVFIIARGVSEGIEKAVYIMFPLMILMLFVLIGYAMTTGHFLQGLSYLFKPDFSKLTATAALAAVGQAFFSLSLATGAIMMYGAYLPQDASITMTSAIIVAADTAVAILAGIAIFPIVFAHNLAPAAGPGLIFQTLPLAFSKLPFGAFFAMLFFIMLLFAALTSAISILEPTVAWLVETWNLSRTTAAISAGIAIWLLGFVTIFSFNIWSHVQAFGMSIFDMLDYLTANIMMPLVGLMTAVFVAWSVKPKVLTTQLQQRESLLYRNWHFALRYIAPIAIVIIFLNFLGII